MRARRCFTFMLLLVLWSSLILAQDSSPHATGSVPRLIRYSGILRDVPPGTVGATFAIYKEQYGGAPLWMEVENVSPDDTGKYTVLLGSNHEDGIPLDLFDGQGSLWLGVQAENQPEQERVLLVSVPYALKAADADTLGGKPLSAFVLANQDGGKAITTSYDGKATSSSSVVPTYSLTASTSSYATTTLGTPNYVAKFVDSINLGSSLLYEAGGKIGIGTTTPESVLDIYSNSGQTVKFGSVPWSLRIGSLQAGTQFIGMGVTKTAANNNYIATSKDISTVHHTALEFGYDGSVRVKQQGHQPDGTVLNLSTSFAITPAGNIGINVGAPVEKLEVSGNLKINGSENGIIFPDGTVQKSSAGTSVVGGLTGVTAGTGLTGGGTSGNPTLSLNTTYTDARYASVDKANTFTTGQTIDGALTISGILNSVSQVVTGDVAASGTVSATSLQGHIPANGTGNAAIKATVDSEDGTGLDVQTTTTTGTATGIHATVNSPASFAAIFDNLAAGNILLARVKIGEYWVKRFRLDGNGRVYANAYSTGGADFAESFAVSGKKTEYEPGDVLVIDTASRRRLTRTQEPYSTLIAGVYSTRPGVLASPYDVDSSRPEQEIPLAVVGVVPCKVTAENGAIVPGDLLVTSSRAGYAMKGTDQSRMLGAVLGKALQGLSSDSGVIEVLVTLQ